MATELMRFALEKTMDRELLEMAAKAAGYDYECTSHTGRPENDQHQIRDWFGMLVDWNPLEDDGDALRLAVKLNIDLRFYPDSEITEPWVEAAADGGDADEALSPDPYAATRRAIVRAAAEIGRTM